MCKRSVCTLAVVLFAVLCARDSAAGVITFDQSIGGTPLGDDPGDPFDNCVVYCAYEVFTTQGFTFTALPNAGPGDQGEGVVAEPGLIPGVADNGTDYLLSGGITFMTRTDGALFSLFSLDAARIVEDDPSVAGFLRVVAIKGGVFLPFVHFDLTRGSGFQAFILPSNWTDLSGVRISGRLAPSGSDSAYPWVVAVDDLTVPEPSSLMLLATGALAMLVRTRQRRPRS